MWCCHPWLHNPQKIQPKYVSKAYRLAKPLEISGLQVEVNTITAALNESVWISSALLCVVELVSIRKIESVCCSPAPFLGTGLQLFKDVRPSRPSPH